MVTDEGSKTEAATGSSPILVLGAIVAALVLAFLALASQQRYVHVDAYLEFFTRGGDTVYKEAEADMWSDFLQVTLPSNPSTGFEWELADVTGRTRVEFMSRDYEPPPKWMVGADGTEVWTFALELMGGADISMEYGQPWEGGAKAARTFNLTLDR